MKGLCMIGWAALAATTFAACKNMDYKTSPNGLKYKIFDKGNKDSTKEGYVLKMNMRIQLSGGKDSILADTYGKMPFFGPVQPVPPGHYDPSEVFKLLKKEDSMVAVIYIDSALKKGLVQEAMLPPFLKKGDKLTYTYKVLQVFKSDSIARIDYQKEMEKDAPRQQKEQAEMMEKQQKELRESQKAEEEALQKSGEKEKQIQQVQQYLSTQKITATKTSLGSFVKIDNPGTGSQVANGKFATVKYKGKTVTTDSTFDSGEVTIQIGKGNFIRGLEDGLKQFKEKGKGAVYIPGFLAYGKEGRGGAFKPYEPLYFDIEIMKVSDTDPSSAAQGSNEKRPQH